MITAEAMFASAAEYEFAAGYEETLLVPTNGYAVLNKLSEQKFLATHYTNVCSGIALIDTVEETGAIAHIYSDRSFFSQGQQKIEAHAQEAWNRFADHLPLSTNFNAVAFGGINVFQGMAKAPVHLKVIREYLDELMSADQKALSIMDSAEYKKLAVSIKELRCQKFLGPFSREDEVNLAYMELKQELLVEEPFEIFNSDKYRPINLYISAKVSEWIGEAFYRAALESGRINSVLDLRFQNAPHDAVVDLTKGKIIVGRSKQDGLFDKNPYEQGFLEAPLLFPDCALV